MPLRCDVASLEFLALSRVGQVVTKVDPFVISIFAILRRFGFGCKLIRPFISFITGPRWFYLPENGLGQARVSAWVDRLLLRWVGWCHFVCLNTFRTMDKRSKYMEEKSLLLT